MLAKTTSEAAAPAVIALAPKSGATIDTFTLPGNVTAYTDSPIFARTSGYLTKWYYDIGSHVKKGALLAEIATPELDQQLTQALADLGTAEANAKNAHSQAQRYQGLVQTNAVSQQDTETFTNQASATASAVNSAQANVGRLKELRVVCVRLDRWHRDVHVAAVGDVGMPQRQEGFQIVGGIVQEHRPHSVICQRIGVDS